MITADIKLQPNQIALYLTDVAIYGVLHWHKYIGYEGSKREDCPESLEPTIITFEDEDRQLQFYAKLDHILDDGEHNWYAIH